MGRSAKTLKTALPELTGIRAIAAGLVFLHHFEKWVPDAGVGVHNGHVGVSIFFALSGFLITRNYRPVFRSGTPFREFALRRVARIYPSYFVLLLVTLAISGRAASQPLGDWLAQLSLTQAFFDPQIWTGLDPVAWSLCAEMAFYLVVPFLLVSTKPFRVLAASVIAALGTGYLLTLLTAAPLLNDPYLIWNFSIFGRFPEFAIGVAAGLAAPKFRNTAAGGFFLGIAVVLAVMGIAILDILTSFDPTYRYATEAPFGNLAFLAFASATAALALAIEAGNRHVRFALGNPVVEAAGKYSYALYLLNAEPLYLGLHRLYGALLPPLKNQPLGFYLWCTAAAAIIYYAIESPAQRWLTNLIRKRTSAAPRSSRRTR